MVRLTSWPCPSPTISQNHRMRRGPPRNTGPRQTPFCPRSPHSLPQAPSLIHQQGQHWPVPYLSHTCPTPVPTPRPLPWQVLCLQCSPSTLSSIYLLPVPAVDPAGMCVSMSAQHTAATCHSRNPPHSRTGSVCFVTLPHGAVSPAEEENWGSVLTRLVPPTLGEQRAYNTTGRATGKKTLEAQRHTLPHAPAQAWSFPKTSLGSRRGMLVRTSCSVCPGFSPYPRGSRTGGSLAGLRPQGSLHMHA